MYPATFDYSAPATIDEVLHLLTEHGDGAKLLACGHSLLPLMKLRFAQPAHVVDLRHVSSLRGVRRESTALVIGAMTTYAELATSSDVRDAAPGLPTPRRTSVIHKCVTAERSVVASPTPIRRRTSQR